MIKKVLKTIESLIISIQKIQANEGQSIPVISFNDKIKSSIQFDWDCRYPISGDTAACMRFKEIINDSIYSGRRVQENNTELLALIDSKSVILEPISEFQRKVEGKYRVEKRKIIITDSSIDEIPYGTLSSILNNNPKVCLKAFMLGVNRYMMMKYRIAHYLSAGIKEGKISSSPNGSKRCKMDRGRIVDLRQDPIIPHYLGCSCSLTPIVYF